VDARISVVPAAWRGLALRFQYRDDGRGAVVFNAYDEVHEHWRYDLARINRCGAGGWRRAQLPLAGLKVPGFPGSVLALGVFVRQGDLAVRGLAIVHSRKAVITRC